MSGLIKWLKIKDAEQQQWAIDYLHKRNFTLTPYSPTSPNPQNTFAYLIQLENNAKSNPHYILAVRSMKSAWRQKNLREKRKGKTEFSLVISKEKKRKLNTLAKQGGKTLGETLEILITEEIQRQVELKEEIKKEKAIINQKLEITKESYKVRMNERDMTINVLLYLLEQSIDKMLHHEIDAIKAYQPTAHLHSGTEEYKETRNSEESEKIRKTLRKIPTWEPNRFSFPLEIIKKLDIKKYIHEEK